MNPSAIYSKSGKGVQEASGKTSLLKRAERAVLSAIDGRTTLAEVAKKVGKPFDGAFEALIAQLDKDGFVREVGGGGAAAAAAPAAKPAARPATATVKIPAAKPPPAAGEDLDFTGIMATPLKAPPKPDPVAAKRAKEQEAALYKARQEAEARAQQERDKARAAAEAKAHAEAEAKLRADAEAKVKAEAEAKARAAREAAVRMAQEARAKAEAAAKAKIEAERLKADAERRAREEAERKAKEEAERARREAEELRLRLEEERKAREEAERKAREEAERRAKEEAERKAREEAERRAKEEAERKAREEAERKAREEAEMAREAAERKLRAEQDAQMRQAREEAERRRAEAERERREAETRRKVEPAPDKAPAPPPEPRPAAAAAGGLDALMADLDSFTQRDNDDRKAREEAEAQAKAERDRKLREEAEQRERERAEREREEAEGRERREEEQRRAREEEERRAREELERARHEAEERARRASEALAASAAQQGADDIGVTDADLGMDDVRRDEAAVAKESRKARREREREAKRLEKEARERDQAAAKAAAKADKQAEQKAEKKSASKPEPLELKATRPRRRRSLGRPVALGLFVLLVAGLGALHVMPVPTEDYQRAASAALRQPVRIGSARLSLLTGVELKLGDVRIGEGTRIASVRAFPQIGSLFGDKKAFRRIELNGVTLRQEALAESLFATARGPNFSVERIFVKDLKLAGPVPLPLLDADVRLNHDGSVRVALLHGPEGLLGQLLPKSGSVEFDITAASFALPFAPEVSLTSFAMKGRATRQGMRIDSWGGGVLGGALSGTANLRWGGTWQLDGALTMRGINAAVFAPALLSEGNAEGSGKFSMSGADPVKLVRTGRVEGSFTIGKGVLGSVDLARAIRTDGREVMGRTQFVEMNGQGSYDRGAVALRNVVIGAGALQAGASADISQSGALSGRIVADVRTPSQSLRTILVLGGTLQEPQVRH